MNINFNSVIYISRERYWSFGHLFNMGYRRWSDESVKDGFYQKLIHIKRNKDANNT